VRHRAVEHHPVLAAVIQGEIGQVKASARSAAA
jgi:hypothetical protein